ncbi:MAG: hypothetical protein JWM33_1981 [Caulobacteraceae bacterium]|nr:hypothetical protein [Caulobacteraceae bacterium]
MRPRTLAGPCLIALALGACATREQIAANIAQGRNQNTHVTRDGRIRLPEPPGLTCLANAEICR